MSSSRFTLLVIAAIVMGAALAAPPAPASRQLVDGIAAVVGDEIILESELDEEFYIYRMRTGSARMSEEDALAVRGEIVREMVDEMLLVAMAKRDTITLRPGQLEDEIADRVEEVRSRHGSDAAFDAALAEEGLTLEKLENMYRDDIERRLLAEVVVRSEVHSKIDVTWGEVEEYYADHAEEVGQRPETFEVAGILAVPRVSEDAKRAAMMRLSEARSKLEKGQSFEEVAREYSDDASASRGGELGWIDRGLTVPEFEEALFALGAGEVSGIVPTRFGFHLIEALEIDGERVLARHILARVTPGPEDDGLARARAGSLRQRVLAGEDFAIVALEHSDDVATREEGGLLGTFTLDELAPAFREVLVGLEPGSVAPVVRGDTGFYVLKLLAHEPLRVATLDEVREDLKEYLFGMRAQAAYVALMERLAKEIHVDIRTRTATGP
jgi:peptidyl-prolyl cis-trans isomerase SurA